MRVRRLAACAAFLALAGAACDSKPAKPGPPKLQPRETFNWTGEEISFSMPPEGWRREGENGGGTKGIRFVKSQSVGEGIGVGDYYILADRNRTRYLREILANFDTYDYGFAWDKALAKTYAYTDSPFTAVEADIAATINSEVAQAGAAYNRHERDDAKAHLEKALAEAQRLRYTLSDVIDRVEFKPERKQEPDKYKLTGRRETMIAGELAVIVDYTVTVPERARTCAAREAYVMHNSHLFICTFIGLQETLAVFDAMVNSIRFPA